MDNLTDIQKAMMDFHNNFLQHILSTMPDVVEPNEYQIEIMERIGCVSGVSIVQDKGTCFKFIGPKMLDVKGCFIAKQYEPRVPSDVIILNLNANQMYWFSTLFHELAHATGTETRLKRDTIVNRIMDKTLGLTQYCFEEIIAESTARRIMEHLGLSTPETLLKSSNYIEMYAAKSEYTIDTEKLQFEVERAEALVLQWIEGIDFKEFVDFGLKF